MTDTQTMPQDDQQNDQPQDQPTPIWRQKQICCQKLTEIFSRTLMQERLLKMVGGDESKLAKYLTSYLTVITEDKGAGPKNMPKKFYCQCSISSLTTCFLESVNMQLPFDGRQLVSIVIYDWEAELDISYKGFVNALNRHYSDAFVECKLVFEDDYFAVDITDRKASYVFKPKDPFAVVTDTFDKIKGGYCFFSYTDKDGEKTSRLVFLSRTQILKNKARAKTDYVWKSDPKAMGEKTCIREGSKLPFAAIDLEIDIEDVDNRHYELEKPSGENRLSLLMAAQKEVLNDKPKETGKTEDDAKDGDTVEIPHGSNVSTVSSTSTGEAEKAAGRTNEQDKESNATSASGSEIIGGKEPAASGENKSIPGKQECLEVEYEEIQHPMQEFASISDQGEVSVPLIPEQTKPPTLSSAAATLLNNGTKPAAQWDGTTVFTGDGKYATQDFPSAIAAMNYVKRIMESRKSKKSRKAIIEGNSPLIGALVKEGHGNAIAELHKLADKGE